jgi:AraC family transcriptional activator of mtrCDE
MDNAANYGLFVLASDPQMAVLVQAVMDKPGDAWTLDQMAALLPMSRATFHRRFTMLSGTTPARWLLNLRLQMACRQLDQGDSVQQVCDNIGYQSVAAFSKVFQQSMGLTPAAWRRRDSTNLKSVRTVTP